MRLVKTLILLGSAGDGKSRFIIIILETKKRMLNDYLVFNDATEVVNLPKLLN